MVSPSFCHRSALLPSSDPELVFGPHQRESLLSDNLLHSSSMSNLERSVAPKNQQNFAIYLPFEWGDVAHQWAMAKGRDASLFWIRSKLEHLSCLTSCKVSERPLHTSSRWVPKLALLPRVAFPPVSVRHISASLGVLWPGLRLSCNACKNCRPQPDPRLRWRTPGRYPNILLEMA